MPRNQAGSKAKAQTTISKFFTSAVNPPGSTFNHAEVATDDCDDFQLVKHSCKKASSTLPVFDEDVSKRRKLCSQKETGNLKNSHLKTCHSSKKTKTSTLPSADNCHTTTTSRLKSFEYGETDDVSHTRDIFRSRCQPSTSSAHDDDDVDLVNQGFTDSDDEVLSQEMLSCPSSQLSSSSTYKNRPDASLSSSHVATDSSHKSRKYTPLEQQFVDIKAEFSDAVLFVECGYKYRFFGDDAQIAARILKIYCRMDHNFMTASIPIHRLFVHVRRIVAAGYKVGIVKQTETSHLKAAGNNKSGPFSRQLTALYTKSTLIGEDVDPLLDSETDCEASWQSNHYLMCVCEHQTVESGTSRQIGLVCVDPSMGEVLYDEFTDSAIYSELDTRINHLQPVEILMPSDTSQHLTAIIQGIAALSETKDDRIRLEIIDGDVFTPTKAVTTVSQFYNNDQSQLQDVLNLPKLVISCLAALSVYLKSFHLERALTVASNLSRYSQRSRHMYINNKSLRSLEVFSNSCDGTEKGSLYWVLKHTCTKFGARLLRKWLARPLLVVSEIEARLDAVEELVRGSCTSLTNLQQIMAKLPDLERGLCSIFHRKCSLAEFGSVVWALEKVRKELSTIHMPVRSSLLQTLLSSIPEFLEDIPGYCSQINEKAARENDKSNLFVDVRKFPVIHARQEEIRAVETLIHDHLREIRLTLKQPGLRYVTVMQTEFLVEVKNSQIGAVPSNWTLVSSTKSVSRFHTPYLVENYRKLNERREQLLLDVNASWLEFLDQFSSQFTRCQRAVSALATLDCLMSLAKTASQSSYCRPQVDEDRAHIEVHQGRHPIIDALNMEQEQFVPNNTNLAANSQRVMVISGPNMGGKSSYIRQVALISIMAQMGSFVPAEAASLGVLDAVYTRIGASDEIFQGHSTFMMELQETAEIMTGATDKSLVVLDELGRGTSTYDGVAIAYACLEYFIQKCKCLVLFVTHFPMMSEFHHVYPKQVQNFHMTFLLSEDNTGNDIRGLEPVTFLYHLSEGAADESYGLNVARLAEIADSILKSAARKSLELEQRVTERVWNHEMFVSLYGAAEGNVKEVLANCKGPNQKS